MSVRPPGPATARAARTAAPRVRGFLHIARHSAGSSSAYLVTYHRLDREGAAPQPVVAYGPQALIELLEQIGVDFRRSDVRGALQDILRFGSANIPDLWLSDQEMVEKGLVEV